MKVELTHMVETPVEIARSPFVIILCRNKVMVKQKMSPYVHAEFRTCKIQKVTLIYLALFLLRGSL